MFQPGNKLSPGRKPGSKNKASIKRVSEILAEQNINPVDEILKLLPQVKPETAIKTWETLLAYTQPKPRELTMKVEQPNSYRDVEPINPALTQEELLAIAKQNPASMPATEEDDE